MEKLKGDDSVKMKEISDDITEGIKNGFWKPIFDVIVYTTIVLIIIFFGLYLYGHFAQKNLCGGWNCFDDIPTSAVVSPCYSNYVNCQIIMENKNESIDFNTILVCGYAEAQSMFALNKEKYEKEVRDINKKYNTSFKLKGMECEQ